MMQTLAWNSHTMTDDWNPRSLSSFQTFPRNASPPGSASPASEQRSSTSSSASSTSSTASSSHFNGHDINGDSYADGDLVDVTLGPNDRRFGFSVVGGLEEGFAPRIDEIAKGSPADKADLEIGDEILEVNGKSLDGATHTEVISHIHQCIRSRTICLRVKRKSGNKLAQDLAANSNVQDAFVIAVEKQARERLERLSALKKIKPVDMTKLSQQLRGSEGSTADPSATGVAVAAVVGATNDADDAPAAAAADDDDDDATAATTAAVAADDDDDDDDGVAEDAGPAAAAAAVAASTNDAGVVSLNVTASPTPSRTAASIISPFGSPSTWLVGDSLTSDVHINGDHVTQVRVDASSVLTAPPPPLLPPPPLGLEEDRDQGEEWTHFAVPAAPRGFGPASPPPTSAAAVADAAAAAVADDDEDDDEDDAAAVAAAAVDGEENDAAATDAADAAADDAADDAAAAAAVADVDVGVQAKQQQKSDSGEGLNHQPPGEGRSSSCEGASAWAPAAEGSAAASTGGVVVVNMGVLNGNAPLTFVHGNSSLVVGGDSSSRGTSQRSLGASTTHSSDGGDSVHLVNMAEWDAGPHREMAVDVPDSFVGRTKTPPRYPPPKSTPAPAPLAGSVAGAGATASAVTATVVAVVNNNVPAGAPVSPGLRKKATLAAAAGGGVAKPVPPPRDHLRIEEDGRLVNRAAPPQLPTRALENGAPPTKAAGVEIDTPSAQQLERIRKYQDEERKRKEKEERLAREDSFLRSSLRGSRKLQALEQSPPATPRPPPPTAAGVVNAAYELDDLGQQRLHQHRNGGVAEDDVEDAVRADDAGLAAWALSQNNYLLNGGMHKIIGIGEVTAALQRVQQQLKKNGPDVSGGVEADLAAVQSLLLSPAFRSALTIHTKVQQVWCSGPPHLPVHLSVQNLVSECVNGLSSSPSPEAVELVSLLSRYEVEGLLLAHDRIAQQATIGPPLLGDAGADYEGDESPAESAFISPAASAVLPASHVTGDGKTFKIIRLEKTNEPLGATVRNDGESVVVGRIVRGGVAERSGLLHEGDEILEVNGVEVRGKSINDVCDLVASMSGTITFLIVPAVQTDAKTTAAAAGVQGPAGAPAAALVKPVQPPNQPNVVHLKAHFDYDPEDDLYIPCKELGISFMKGDILHVISQDDPNWWQAFREGEEDQTLAGLIPSRSFQLHRREAMKQAMVIDDSMDGEVTSSKGTTSTLLCAKKQQKKKKKKKTSFRSPFGTDADADEVATYEEVGLYYPRANHKRPIVLIGPPNIGRKELREMLMQDSERFAPAIPHTSRPKKDNEVNGQDYHFISRGHFEADIVNRRFVEHGEYEKAYYGTTVDAIRAVVNAGKFCVLNLHPQSLKILKESDLMPFVVFIAPPSLEKLRAKKREKSEPFKDDELKEIIEKAREMEEVYGHYFDMVLVNGDEERTYSQLFAEVNRLEREPQWVPGVWLRSDHK